ncbi:MAG: hypothetical protein ACJAZO_003035 [Myxococcota bacterium]|jgi:hypothetical protein
MFRASLVIVTAVALCQIASAQDCPPGAATQATIPSGTSFRALSLHPDDAYYSSSYADIVGMDGTTTGELSNNGGCWYGGPVNSESGESYYFYKVAVVTNAPSGGTTSEAPTATTVCPSDAIRATPRMGTSYTVLGLHPDDAYSSSATVSNGQTVTFDEGTTIRDGCWISGAATTAFGADLYFFKVAVSAGNSGRSATSSCPPSATTGAIASGTRVRLLGIHAEDAYTTGAGNFSVGDIMTTTAAMNPNGACWYGGPTETTDGSTQYFYKAAFEVIGSRGGGDKGKDSGVGYPSVAEQLRSLNPSDSLDARARDILLSNFDRNGSGTIDTMNEVNRIPCDVLLGLNVPYQARWGRSVRESLGFKNNLNWVGGSLGFSESMRTIADRQLGRCGIE